MSSKRKISILGVTGSIGQSTVDVILAHKDQFETHLVTAHKNVEGLAKAAIQLRARKAIIADETLEDALKERLNGHEIEVLSGMAAIESAAGDPVDLLVAAIMGFAGLKPIINAIENKNNVAIANKEPLVAAGAQIMALARAKNVKILPIDSEHNAIFQVFENENKDAIEKIILTASGGPFLNWTVSDMECATPDQAIAHPNWTMGQKISVDSATMMNKALEIIEAHYLFDMPPEKIDVIIHPQSTVHSMVSYKDGSFLAQMGASDMRTPIAYALAWPHRIDSGGEKLDLNTLSSLTFLKPNYEQFPALKYAYYSMEMGQGACVAMNAANEVAVEQFLEGNINFGDIMRCVAYALNEFYPQLSQNTPKTVEEIVELDNTVRNAVIQYADTISAQHSKERA